MGVQLAPTKDAAFVQVRRKNKCIIREGYIYFSVNLLIPAFISLFPRSLNYIFHNL